jgi:hypothetical protein
MIISMLKGGMGNQMFQYAAAFALANRHQTQLKLDIHYLLDKSKRYFRHTYREYALDVFNIRAEIASPREISQFTIPRIGNKYFYHLKKRIFKSYNVFEESNVHSQQEFFNIPNSAYLDGFWQNASYIRDIRPLLIKEFSLKEPLPEYCTDMFNKIKNSNSVCVVFRRGDYVNHPELDITQLSYYHAAIDFYQKRNEKLTYFIFSDDIPWCKANFAKRDVEIVFVDQMYTGPKAQYYLQLMIACKKYIIPNSTYPWWAAWLNDDQGKVVIAPKKWFRSQTVNINPIVPNDWITL